MLRSILNRVRWYRRWKTLEPHFRAGGRRIIYGLTPPPALSNIGDQAQVVAIMDWLKRHFPDRAIIEVDKDEAVNCTKYFKSFVRPDDVVVLHSGGNMGDRGIYSERARRTLISNLPRTRIVSLPQTIHFHDTPTGQRELETSKAIYNAHENLTVIARDHRSFALAQAYFPKCTTDEAPDFVLSYDWPAPAAGHTNGKVLFCMREDDESAIGADARKTLIASIGKPHDVFDTTLAEPIPVERRKAQLDETLAMFAQYDAVVTDRFHGLIFSVLTRRPTVVLPTVDHKLTSAFDWFDGVRFVRFSSTIAQAAPLLDAVSRVEDRSLPDWNALHFDRLARHVAGEPDV